jgi:hypothetical protein
MATTIYQPTVGRASTRHSSRLLAGVAVAALAISAGAFQLGRVEAHHATSASTPASATVSATPIAGPSAAQFQLAQTGRTAPAAGCTPTMRVHPC